MKRDYSWLTGPTGCPCCHVKIPRAEAIKILEEFHNILCKDCRNIKETGFSDEFVRTN